jgi:hypothetical protein
MMMIDDDCESTIFDRTVVEFYKGQTDCVGSFGHCRLVIGRWFCMSRSIARGCQSVLLGALPAGTKE